MIRTRCCGPSPGKCSLYHWSIAGLFNSSSISSLGEPISNSPGGMSTNFMPMELVISTGTPRCLAQASWCSLAFVGVERGDGGRGAPGGRFHLPSAPMRLPTAGRRTGIESACDGSDGLSAVEALEGCRYRGSSSSPAQPPCPAEPGRRGSPGSRLVPGPAVVAERRPAVPRRRHSATAADHAVRATGRTTRVVRG